MSLGKRLESMRRASAEKFDDATLAIMHRATEALRASGIAERATGEGDAAPSFALAGSKGETVSSSALLARGPAVLTFFRGHW